MVLWGRMISIEILFFLCDEATLSQNTSGLHACGMWGILMVRPVGRLLKRFKLTQWCNTSFVALVYFKERKFGENISIYPNCMSVHSKSACRQQGLACSWAVWEDTGEIKLALMLRVGWPGCPSPSQQFKVQKWSDLKGQSDTSDDLSQPCESIIPTGWELLF